MTAAQSEPQPMTDEELTRFGKYLAMGDGSMVITHYDDIRALLARLTRAESERDRLLKEWRMACIPDKQPAADNTCKRCNGRHWIHQPFRDDPYYEHPCQACNPSGDLDPPSDDQPAAVGLTKDDQQMIGRALFRSAERVSGNEPDELIAEWKRILSCTEDCGCRERRTIAFLVSQRARIVELERERNGLRKGVPYREFCRRPDKCAGLSSCPRDPCCCD